MNINLRLLGPGIFKILALLAVFFLPLLLQAQCPAAISCTPGNAPASAFVFGMGIYYVEVGAGAGGFTNSSGGVADGYQDYSCTKKATITEGAATNISINTNANANENVRIWIDLNNNGTFAASELVYSSNNAKSHTGTFTVPANASVVKNTLLRMRIAADNFSSPIPSPCSTPAYSQTEDYGITVLPNTTKPAVEFTVNNPVTCSPTVQFQNQTQFGATSYLWDFGDNTTSTAANPSHTYAATGTYNVKLKACNAFGCDSITKTNYITYHTNTPVPATCTPATLNFCCGYGITHVNFGNGLMTNSSANGSAGYQDFTCSKSVSVYTGNSYPISLTTGSNPQDTRIYIDLNNDGNFTGGNEMVLEMLNQVNPTGSIIIPGTAFPNTPLRMRIISDNSGSSFTGCYGVQTGQAEDYTILISPNPNPLVAQFTSNHATGCDTLVQFTDQSINGPSSWLWNFGDPASGAANTSTLRNPVHIYRNSGNYTVTLTVSNASGSDSVTKANYISVVKPCVSYCSLPGLMSYEMHINNVTLSNLNNSSGVASNGYSNFTNLSATLQQGSAATLRVGRSSMFLPSSVTAWIDFNRNGIFELSERVLADDNSTNVKSGQSAATFTVPASAPLGRTRMRIIILSYSSALNGACISNLFNSSTEVEDYTILIRSGQELPLTNFYSGELTSCNGIVNFYDNSAGAPTSWSWNFGDPASGAANTSTLQNPTHTFSSPGTYTVSLTTCNANGCNTIIKSNQVTYSGSFAIVPPTCRPQTLDPCCNRGIRKVTFTNGVISKTSGNSTEGYQDYTCTDNGIVDFLKQQTLEVQPFDLNDRVRVWIDYNNDGGFDFGEMVMNTIGGGSVTFNFPPGVVKGVYLRMRVMASDPYVTPIGYCGDVQKGQMEDYAIKIIEPTIPYFTHNGSCTGTIAFTDKSTSNPTSWQWNFGDPAAGPANTSTLENPVHTYINPGTYNVTLTACNVYGCHTITKEIWVGINPVIQVMPMCQPTSDFITGSGISAVRFAGINNVTGNNNGDYNDYTCSQSAGIFARGIYPIQVVSDSLYDILVSAWIDYDNDGVFQSWEKVMNVIARGNHNYHVTVPANAARNTFLRMRVMTSSGMGSFVQPPGPCEARPIGETEDYAIIIWDPVGVAEPDFASEVNVYPNPTTGKVTVKLQNAKSEVYTLEVTNLLGQIMLQKQATLSTDEETQFDLSGYSKGIYFIRISNSNYSTVKKIVVE